MNQSSPVQIGWYPRYFLLVLSGTNFALGLVFYLVPSAVISYWAWPVMDLAVRFLGAIFLAIAIGCLSALKARVWQRAKILVLVGGAFFELTGIISIVTAATGNGNSTIWPWALYFLTAGTSLMILLKLHGWHRKQSEEMGTKVAPTGTKIFFALQTSVVGVLGLMMVLLPGIAQSQFWPWKVATPTLQTFGALFLATCLATGWAFFQRNPARILVLLPLDAIFPSLALVAVGISWNVIVAESPSRLVTFVWIGLYSFVATGSTILYLTLRRRASVQS